MASEVRQFTVSIPAGTPVAAPVTVNLVMPARIVRRVRARVARGPNFLMGFALGSSGVKVVPWNDGAWIVGDNETWTWDLENQITSGAWQLIGYNLGTNAHSVYLVFELDPPNVAPSAFTGTLLSLASLSSTDTSQPPPGAVDGHLAARINALAAVQAAFGLPLTVVRQALPAAGSQAALDYAATRQDAVDVIGALQPGQDGPGPVDSTGYAAGRRNALAAVQGALGMTVAPAPVARPVPGTLAAIDYARARAAALTALGGI